MWKSCLINGLAIVVAASLPMTVVAEQQSTPVNPTVSDSHLCYLKTTDGRTLNLTKLCQQDAEKTTEARPNNTANVNADLGGLEAPAKAGCYVIDAAGNPCT